MTDIATALAMPDEGLGAFDGKDVLRTTVAVTNAGDGLSQAMQVDPQLMRLGDTVVIVLECEVAKVQFVPIKDGDGLSRVHVLRAGNATVIDGDLVAEHLADQAERILRAKEAAAGMLRLPYPEEVTAAHEAGEHKDLVEGCPWCDDEVTVAAAEVAAAEGSTEPTPVAGRKRKAT